MSSGPSIALRPNGTHVTGIPEISEALRQDGAILLPSVVGPAICRSTAEAVEARYRSCGNEYEHKNGVEGPHLRELVDPVLESSARSAFLPIARQFMGAADIVVPINHLLFRRRDDTVDAIYERDGARHMFHQDHGLVPTFFPLNAWIALSQCCGSCHGLSIVLPTPTVPTRTQNFELEEYLKAPGGHVWSPEMQPGDMLVFHQLTIHGSWISRGKPDARFSVEFRAGRSSDAPETYRSALWALN